MKAAIGGVVLGAMVLATAGPALARRRPYVPEPGDTSLRAKCRSEASMMGGAGGKGGPQRAMETQEMRRNYFKTCMQGG